MKVNVRKATRATARDISVPRTHEGAVAYQVKHNHELQRSVMACFLWEDSFYESGEDHAVRVKRLIAQCDPQYVAGLAITCREQMKLRHMPLLLVREMARLASHKHLVASTLERVIQRPDELTEFLAIYWKDDKDQPLSAQVKRGLAAAFSKFNEHQLAKYDRDGSVRLRDALFLSHAKPIDATIKYTKLERKHADKYDLAPGEELFKKVVDRTLETDTGTWEQRLSAGADKKETFETLMREQKLGALAFLRNLRNMEQAGVSGTTVSEYLDGLNLDRVLPFRFISAARAVPKWENTIERGMLRCLDEAEKLPGKTCIVVDNSGSMSGTKVSSRSELDRSDAACALAVLLREICEDVIVIGFGTQAKIIPARRGFALVDAIKKGPGGGTNTDYALALAENEGYDRIIVVTDEQSHTSVRAPAAGTKGYFINVANYKNGIGYGPWVHIDGWSEAIVEYIRAYEAQEL